MFTELDVTGVGGVPETGVTAVVMNVTVDSPTAGSFLTAWPSGETRPGVSNLNFVPGQTVPNLVTVKVGANGRVNLFNSSGWAHVIADVVGYYTATPPGGGGRFTSLTPTRLLDTRTGMILVYCTFNLPFAIWTLRPTLDGIPKELDEAAFVDGASSWKVITEIVFPLCRPGLAVTLILTWVFAWNEYLLAATLTNFNARTLTTGLSEYITTTGTSWGIMAAISVFTLIPALIIFSLVQRHIVAGLTFGAVKG